MIEKFRMQVELIEESAAVMSSQVRRHAWVQQKQPCAQPALPSSQLARALHKAPEAGGRGAFALKALNCQ
ncbi:MAG: hypothetical protein JSS24_11270 [Proteobacteria bacterium]|nr:hypothetical protein [Pseudomonadota bacterium]